MKQVKKGLEESRIEIIYQEKEALPSTFVGIDWLASLIKDKEKEAKLLKRLRLFVRDEKIVAFQNILLALRNITHLVYDITYDMSYHLEDYNNSERLEIVNRLNALMKECVYLAVYSEKDFIKYVDQDQKDQSITMKDNRVMNDLKDIQEMLDIINENLFNL